MASQEADTKRRRAALVAFAMDSEGFWAQIRYSDGTEIEVTLPADANEARAVARTAAEAGAIQLEDLAGSAGPTSLRWIPEAADEDYDWG
jgi:hypothetical protein